MSRISYERFCNQAYGSGDHQRGDLSLPDRKNPAVVCLLHGGFWRMPYGREEMQAIALDLVERGYAVWNLEYRRIGAGGGWPSTFEDVIAGVDHLATLADRGVDLDLQRVIVAGHSAGGHLALWSAQGLRHAKARVMPIGVAGLAAVSDLVLVHALGSGGNAVAELMGGSPQAFPERYAAASPSALLPLRTRQLLIHGAADDVLPVDVSQRYARAAANCGDQVEYVELAGAGHMEFLDPGSAAHAALCRWLGACCTM